MRLAEALSRPLAYAGCMAILGWRACRSMVTPPFEFRTWVAEMEHLGVQSRGVAAVTTIFTGIGKSIFSAFRVAIIGCYNGLRARGGANGVGRTTTNTIVVASVLVLIGDFFLTQLFYILF